MTEPTPIRLDHPDAGSRAAGDILRRAREGQGMTLEGLASVIKVTPNKLEALERGRYDALPDASFTRALAMTVCRALKIDPSDVLAGLPVAQPVPLAGNREPLNQPFKEGRSNALFDKQFEWSGLLSAKYLAPLALLVAAGVIHFLPEKLDLPGWLQRSAKPVVEAQAPAPVASAPV
jgi:cytoskeleton protein RodZ